MKNHFKKQDRNLVIAAICGFVAAGILGIILTTIIR